MPKEEVVYVIIDGQCLEAYSTDCVVTDGGDKNGIQEDEYKIDTIKWVECQHAHDYRLVDGDGKRIQGHVEFEKNGRYMKPINVYVAVDPEDYLFNVEEGEGDEGYDCSDVEIEDNYC